jgi:hypothetical protein
MLRFPGIQRLSRRKGLLAASSLLLCLSAQGLAQSGRKTTKPPQNPANVPQTNDESSKPKVSTRDLQNKVTLLVGRQATSKKLLSEDAIFENFVKHLNEITVVDQQFKDFPVADIRSGGKFNGFVFQASIGF